VLTDKQTYNDENKIRLLTYRCQLWRAVAAAGAGRAVFAVRWQRGGGQVQPEPHHEQPDARPRPHAADQRRRLHLQVKREHRV